MTKRMQVGEATRNHYSPQYKREVLALAEKVGAPTAAALMAVGLSKLLQARLRPSPAVMLPFKS